jgi:ubiquitin-protein ligase
MFSYPIRPPSVRFATRVFHPNVSRHGDIGLDCIQHNWSLALTIAKVLISVQSLLTDPYCRIAMEKDVAEMYVNDRQRFESIARSWTSKYAMNDVPKPNKKNNCS